MQDLLHMTKNIISTSKRVKVRVERGLNCALPFAQRVKLEFQKNHYIVQIDGRYAAVRGSQSNDVWCFLRKLKTNPQNVNLNLKSTEGSIRH